VAEVGAGMIVITRTDTVQYHNVLQHADTHINVTVDIGDHCFR